MDDSRSMRIRDVNDGTRTAALQRTFADTAPLSKQLAEKFAIRRFRFAADASPIAGASALKANGKVYEAHVYPDVNHGFHNDTTPRYDQAAAELSWTRTIDFFRKKLG